MLESIQSKNVEKLRKKLLWKSYNGISVKTINATEYPQVCVLKGFVIAYFNQTETLNNFDWLENCKNEQYFENLNRIFSQENTPSSMKCFFHSFYSTLLFFFY